MVGKPRHMIAMAMAGTMAVAASAPVLGAFEASVPNPVRQGNVVRVQAAAARGNVVAIGWREGSKPGVLSMAYSKDGGDSYLKNNRKLRKFRTLGLGNNGMSLDICAANIWIGSAANFPGDAAKDSDVVITRRSVKSPIKDAGQTFVTSPGKSRRVRDVSVACIGNRLLAIAWLERVGSDIRAKLMIRDLSSDVPAAYRRVFGLGAANFGGGISVAATAKAVHVAWSKGNRQHVTYKSFLVGKGKKPPITKQATQRLATGNARWPRLATVGQRVALAYTDRGKVKVKISTDRGATFGSATRIMDSGTIRDPSVAHSIDLMGRRIVVDGVEAGGGGTPQRIQTYDLGADGWSDVVSFGHDGARVGALRRQAGNLLLQEAWHNSGPGRDTLRAQHEVP